MKKKRLSININYASLILSIVIITLWEVGARLGWLPQFIIPAPSEVIVALFDDWDNIWMNAQVTLIQAFIGLGIGIALAFLLAIIMDIIPWFYKSLYPILVVTQTIPTVAIAPILVLWLGYDMTPKIVLVVLTTIFPIIISILSGFAQCDQDSIQLLKLMGANRWQILTHVKLPSSMTYFLSGLRVSVSYAFVSSVVAEWLGGFEGLGVYMIQTKRAFAYDKMFAVIVFISVLSLIFMGTVSIVEKYLTPWRFNEKKRGAY
ncbi:ABC transporter permease [Aerococcaceae bacterium WGS1372]